MVSLIEYPAMVKIAPTITSESSPPMSENRPSVIITS